MKRIALLAVLTIIFTPTAKAFILVDSNDASLTNYQSADGNNITTDTATGFDWLDIDTTINISFNEMTTRLGVVGGQLEAFRYATLSEVDVFFNNLGIPTGPLPLLTETSDPGAAIWLAAVSHTGFTGTQGTPGDYAAGLTSTSDGTVGGVMFPLYGGTLATQSILWSRSYTANTHDPAPSGGSWLVRSTPSSNPIPEATTAIVWSLIGLMAFCTRPRRFGK